jgi:hypothetical protein
VVLRVFMWWEIHQRARGGAVLVDPAMLSNRTLRGGLTSFLFQYLLQAVSAVPDEQSGDVGGIQNTVTNLGASIGTALAGAVLIAALTTSFLTGVQNNPDVPKDVAAGPDDSPSSTTGPFRNICVVDPGLAVGPGCRDAPDPP